jgi:hypothetical protein
MTVQTLVELVAFFLATVIGWVIGLSVVLIPLAYIDKDFKEFLLYVWRLTILA